MDIEHRLGFAGIGVAAVALVVTQVDSVQLASGFSLEGRVSTNGARGVLNGGGPKLFAHTGDGGISVRGGRLDR